MRFILLDRISEVKLGEYAKGIKNVTMSEDFFEDHFPKYPIMPGALMLEALAQLGGFLLGLSCERLENRKVWAIMSMVENLKFKKVVRPGDQLNLEANILTLRPETGVIQGKAFVDNKLVVTAKIIYTFFERKNILDDDISEVLWINFG